MFVPFAELTFPDTLKLICPTEVVLQVTVNVLLTFAPVLESSTP